MQVDGKFRIKKRRYIAIPPKCKELLADEFKATKASVRLALDFKVDSPQAEAIRARALEMGGFIAYKAV